MPGKATWPALLDTSVIAKWFLDEEHSDKALELRQQGTIGNAAVSELSFYELANLLRFNKSYDEAKVHRAITDLAQAGLPVLPFDVTVLHIAIGNAYEYGLSLYDAYFVAQADLEGMRFVTADELLAEKVKGRSSVITLQEYKY